MIFDNFLESLNDDNYFLKNICEENYFTENEYENYSENFFCEEKNYNMNFTNEIEIKNSTLKIDEKKCKIKNSTLKIDEKKCKKKRKRKIHDRSELGNIRSKIKNKFSNFIIKFLNEKIKEKHLKLKFRKINYQFINLRNKTSNEKLMNMKIEEFLSFDISSKYKNINKNNNINILKKTENFMKKFYDLTYAEFYNKFFLKKKYFNDFINEIQQKEIKFKKYKNFENYINFDNYINKIKNVALNYTSYYNNKKNYCKL